MGNKSSPEWVIKEIKDLRAENKELREVLEFYAKGKHCGNRNKRLMQSDCYAVEDGTIAQQALKGEERE